MSEGVSEISRRKQEHLDLCANRDVESGRSTLLEEVTLLHEALPELSVAEVDPSVEWLGRRLAAPLLITGMTGGTPRAADINRSLATVAQKHGLAFGLGSQRAMWREPELRDTYRVRDAAPDALLLGNVGAVLARDAGSAAVGELVQAIDADALCVHLNAAQELVQDEGDRDFRGCLDAIAALVRDLPVPVVVKETGCGLSPGSLRRLREAGVAAVDVAGAGGTSWTGVEALRGSPRQQRLGRELREWGIPTAVSVAWARRLGLCCIASGGIRSSTDVVRALALGARAAGMALPFLRAVDRGGQDAALALADQLVEGIRMAMLLVGARDVAALPTLPRLLGPRLRQWLEIADQSGPIGQGGALVGPSRS